MNKKSLYKPLLALAVLCAALISGCAGGTPRSPYPTTTVTVPPDVTLPPIDSILPTDPNGLPDDAAAQNAQSAQLEQAQTLAWAAERLAGVSDAAAVVTDDGRCLVALKLSPNAKLNTSLRKKIAVSMARGYLLRITDDRVAFEKIAALQKSMATGKSVSYDEIKAEWDKIQIAEE